MNNKNNNNKKPQYRSYYSLEKDEATVVWIIAMLVSTIFRGNWALWILETAIWWNYIKNI